MLDERRMGGRDVEQGKAGAFEMPDRFTRRERRAVGPGEAMLDGNFPDRDGRYGDSVVRVGQNFEYAERNAPSLGQSPYRHMRVEEKLHLSAFSPRNIASIPASKA